MTRRRPNVEKLIAHINRKGWWHVPPSFDARAYEKRGKFLASTYEEAEFYGRPLDSPEKASIQKPLIGDNNSIERTLFGRTVSFEHLQGGRSMRARFALDARMKKAALAKGFDSIVLLATRAFREFKETGKLPRSIELNIFEPGPQPKVPAEVRKYLRRLDLLRT